MRKMMARNLRRTSMLAAIPVLALAGTGVVAWTFGGRPDPATASRAEILRWLATADISGEPPSVQFVLLDRVEEELQAGLPLDGVQQAPQQHRAMLAANAAWLKRLWFDRRVQEYQRLRGQQRNDFLDARIETLLAWSALEAAFQEPPGSRGGSAADFFNDIQRWIREEPDPHRQEEMTAAVQDGVVQWLATRELAEQPHDVRTELALRIAAQLDAGLAPAGAAAERPQAEQARLRRNGVLLMESWLLHQAGQYAELPADEKTPFLDAQIDRVSGWGVLQWLASSVDGNAGSGYGLAEFPLLAQGSIDRAADADKPKLQRLIGDVQARLFARLLEQAMGGRH